MRDLRSMRHFVLGMASCNTYLVSFLYKHLCRKLSKSEESLIADICTIDTISNPFGLLDLKRGFESGKFKYSKDKNFNNLNIYGYWRSLFPFLNLDDAALLPSIEHGLILADDVYEDICLTGRCSVVTFGSYRQEIIRRKTSLPVFTVGPYIQYAQDFYSEERLSKEKKKNGKTLLVFPGHSTDECEVNRQIKHQIGQIKKCAEGFKTVIISVFWWDLDDAMVKAFQAEGFKIACSGFRDDSAFASRLKTMIRLSDVVLSDGIGTHVGFCRALGREVVLMNSGSIKRTGEWERQREGAINSATQEIVGALSEQGSSYERRTMEHYWGLGIKRTQNELQTIASISRDITWETKGFRRHASNAAERLLLRYQAEKNDLAASLLASALKGEGYSVRE